MTKLESEKSNENVCDLSYLSEIMGGKKHLMIGIIDAFLQQVPEELQAINDAIIKINFSGIKNIAHTMKSSVSIMGISRLTPVLQKMEDMSAGAMNGLSQYATNIEEIKQLHQEVELICKQAFDQIERERHNYF